MYDKLAKLGFPYYAEHMERLHRQDQSSEPQTELFAPDEAQTLAARVISDAAAYIKASRARQAGLDYDRITARREQLIASGGLVLDEAGVYRPKSSI